MRENEREREREINRLRDSEKIKEKVKEIWRDKNRNIVKRTATHPASYSAMETVTQICKEKRD